MIIINKIFILMKQILGNTFWKFVLVGIANTLVGMGVMFSLYNLAHCSYWVSTASNYFFSSVFSYFLNKHFTFKNKDKGWKPAVRFGLNIFLCYLGAYSSAKFLVAYFLPQGTRVWLENGSMLLGMVLFINFNYIGQKFYVFRK